MKKDKVKIVNEKTEKKVVEEKITTEILAKSIKDLAVGYKRLMASGLTKYAIVVLLHGVTPSVGKKEIETILNSMERLEGYYLRG